MGEKTGIEGRVALVSGASRGIGRAVAIELAAEGAKIIINYKTSDEKAKAVKGEIEVMGGEAELLRFDISSPEEVKKAVKDLVDKNGRLDILVNNAGLTRDNLLAIMKESEWDDVIDTNLKGAFLLTKAAIRPMIKARWGRIVNITSVAGQYGNPGQANYSASKAGIIGFTRSVARELAERNITVNAVSPGLIDTEMTDALPEKARDAIISQIPMGRIGTPKDVAQAVSFLVSDYASYITGQVIGVNGGLYM
jgi:3-oxoacyl-[acyl-carrier protein] reductase